jgi:hypothetical protein
LDVLRPLKRPYYRATKAFRKDTVPLGLLGLEVVLAGYFAVKKYFRR